MRLRRPHWRKMPWVMIPCALIVGCGSSHQDTSSINVNTPSQSNASALPAPSEADGKMLESVVLASIKDCTNIANAQIADVSHANERITEAQEARESLANHVSELVALYRRVNPEAIIPYGEGRQVTTKQDIQSIIEELNKKPSAPPNSPACDTELAERLSQETVK